MEIHSKFHVEQPAPPGVHRQRSYKRDEQTEREKNQLFWPLRRRVKFGTVIDDLKHVLALPKLFGVRRIVSPVRGAENLAETRHHQIKTPITP